MTRAARIVLTIVLVLGVLAALYWVFGAWPLLPSRGGGQTEFELVVTSVHELTHVAGEASEAGATLLTAVAGLRSDHPYSRYSTALHTIASLDALEPELLPHRARMDLQAARDRSLQLNNPTLLAAQRTLFGAYLDWQGGGDGRLDYATGTAQLVLAWRAGLLD